MRRRVILALALAGACAPEEPQPPPTLTELRERVFDASCVFSACHKGASPAGGLGLDGNVHAALVERPSSVLTDRILVVPESPDDSYLLEKLESSAPATGDPMPPGAPLEAERIELVRAWIDAGAADD